MNDLGTWQLTLLGEPCLRAPDGTPVRCDGRTLEILTLLAVEGPLPRARLADLLWPGTAEQAGRNNLVQQLRRMQKAFGTDLVQGADPLALAPFVETDVRALLEGQVLDPEHAVRPLLEGLTLGDRPDLFDWLTVWRERCEAVGAQRLAERCARLEREGDLSAATEAAEKLLRVLPLSEDAWRRMMRLQYLQGDARAALRTYDRCVSTLREHLHTEPLPETRDLAREIARGARLPRPARATLPPLPPPALVGRADAWARLEAAWAAGQLIFVTGAPGVGKTRLLRDFADSKGAYLSLDGRPGDTSVPYSCATRNTRTYLARHPDLPLEAHERAELARLLPEYGEAGVAAPPLENEADVQRFHGALLAVTRRAMAGLTVVVLDDLQSYDDATLEYGAFMMSSAYPLGAHGIARHLIGFRAGELSPRADALVHGLIEAGVAVLIELEPITDRDVRALVESLGLPQAEGLAAQLTRYAGGNPLFILETVKYLHENGGLERGLPSRLPPPGQAGSVLEQRLARLSHRATLVARAAAVLQADFTLELITETLGLPLLDTVSAWEELEAAQLVQGERLGHDLIAEAVRAGTPAAVGRVLHRASARVLTQHQADPARIAGHWLEGGDDRQAAPWLLRAGEAAAGRLRLREAAGFFERAALILEAAGEDAAAFAAFTRRAEVLQTSPDRAARQASLDALFERASGPTRSARAWHLQAELHVAYGEGAEAEEAARAGLTRLGGVDDVPLRANLLADVGAALWAQERMAEAASVLADAVTLLEPLGDTGDLASNLSNLAVVLDHQDRHREAEEHHRRACALLDRLGGAQFQPVALANLGICLAELGRAREAQDVLWQAEAVARRADGALQWDATRAMLIAQTHVDLAEYDLALRRYREALALPDGGGWARPQLHTSLAELLLTLGSPEEAETHARAASTWPNLPSTSRSRALIALARVLTTRGAQEAEETFREAERALEGNTRPLPRIRWWLTRGPLESPERALAWAREALRVAQAHELGGYEVTAHVRVAQAMGRAGRFPEARCHAEEAVRLLAHREPADISRGEAHLTLCQVLLALNDPGADRALEEATAWLQGALTGHVPPEYRPGFTARNAVNAQILDAVRQRRLAQA
ncbi:ATP-binding protein [Deinococcus apachensis]|uniref:ATP-binding protein n=1 Tax=Deinococcus apachensis TaxID=309886 RepID=UPI00035F7638|nr:AAA family ATPase [Deinococcus apachensis]